VFFVVKGKMSESTGCEQSNFMTSRYLQTEWSSLSYLGIHAAATVLL
jgi:hypothetical protein